MDEGVEAAGEGHSLTKAAHQGRLRLTRLLLEGGAYINESNERGETPLMVACRSRHPDSQGACKARMVRYLLERQADPNIQDKAGLTALMHACLARAGPAVARLLLDGGADLGLQDHAGCSALAHAVQAEDRDTLQVLLSACRARGKEVIIITTATSPSGRLTTRQYLNAPPGPTCASPSQVDVEAEPEPPGGAEGPWDPGSAAWGRNGPGRRLQHRVASLQEEVLGTAAEEEPVGRAPGLRRRPLSRHQSIDVKDAGPLLHPWEQAEPRKPPCDDGHPEGPGDADPSQAALEDCRALLGKKKALAPAPSLPSGSRDALDSVPPGPLGRRGQAVLERRGSAAFLEHSVAQARPGFLPPLSASPHPPVSDLNLGNRLCGLLSCGQRVPVPTVPIFPKEFKSKKMLLRRQSLQTEQIKQLVNF